MHTDKLILDACCGGRMMWFNKQYPRALYIDIREAEKGICPQRPAFHVKPDLLLDFRHLPFPDKTFKLIAWDPPHIRSLAETSILRKRFGTLHRETWRSDLAQGFDELWRVLDEHGTLVFKWSEPDIMLREVLACFKRQPLFGHTTGSNSKTHWVCFFKDAQDVKLNGTTTLPRLIQTPRRVRAPISTRRRK